MSKLPASVSLLENPHTDPDRLWRRYELLLVGAIMLFAFVLPAWSLLTTWRTGSAAAWDEFWHLPSTQAGGAAAPLFMMLAVLLRLDTFRLQIARASARVVAVRKAAIDGDDTSAPLAREQPAAIDASALTSGPIHISPLTRPRSSRHLTALPVIICLLFCLAFVTGITTLILLIQLLGGSLAASRGASVLIMGGIALACAALGAFLLHTYRLSRLSFTVTVDDHGLHWRIPAGLHRHRRIAWSQAQALVTSHRSYALLTSRGAFCWELTHRATAEARQAHDQLASLIVAYTGLPLRDLTLALDAAIAESSTTTARKPKIQFPLGTPGTPGAVPGIPALSAASGLVESDPGSSRRLFRLGSLIALMAIPTLLLYGAGFALQRIQPGYFATFLTRSEAQPPLYLDKLDWPDNDWPVWQPISTDPRSYTYVHPSPTQGVYQLTGPDPQSTMDAWESQSFSDAVIEVTARQLKAASGSAVGAVGLILRVRNDGDQFVNFQIDPSGYWVLYDYSSARRSDDGWQCISGGQSAAIHRGVGASNRVAILMRGDTYVLYVNGTFIGAGTDNGAPSSGAAGVYVNSDAAGGQFSNFAVYPVYSGLPLII